MGTMVVGHQCGLWYLLLRLAALFPEESSFVGGGVCSRGAVPQPPINGSRWEPARSSPKCTASSTPAVCPVNPRCDCNWTRGGTLCDFERDDGTECDCVCCCEHYQSIGIQCRWGGGRWHSSNAAGSLLPGEVCTAVCQPGFLLGPGSPAAQEFACSDAGAMRPSASGGFACVEKRSSPCSVVPPCEDASCEWDAASCTEPGAPDAECTAQCKPGYVAAGDADRVPYRCQPSGGSRSGWGWVPARSPELLRCSLACPAVPPRANQHWRTGHPDDARLCGAPPYSNCRSCQAECDAGYHPEGGACTAKSPTVGLFNCTGGGHWVTQAPSGDGGCACVPNQCSGARPVEGGSRCETGHYLENHSASCFVHCERGFERISGSTAYRCETDGTWWPVDRSSPLICVPTCPEQLGVGNADTAGCHGVHGRSLAVTNDECVGKCAPDYVETARAVYRCAYDGNWVPVDIQVHLQCSPIAQAKPCDYLILDNNMHFTATCNHKHAGTECVAECDDGYEQTSGSLVFSCSSVGIWVSLAIQPARCVVTKTQVSKDFQLIDVLTCSSALSLLLLLLACWRKRQGKCQRNRLDSYSIDSSRSYSDSSLIRRSLLGTVRMVSTKNALQQHVGFYLSNRMLCFGLSLRLCAPCCRILQPGAQLAERDVQARWLLSQQLVAPLVASATDAGQRHTAPALHAESPVKKSPKSWSRRRRRVRLQLVMY
jgi:hypothetical protein